MEDPDTAWQEARWLERQRDEIADLTARGELDRNAGEARWRAALAVVRPEALALAARFLVWRDEQARERGPGGEG